MLCTLAFLEARYAFQMHSTYIDTEANHLADDLSRKSLSSFFLKVPHADKAATPFPNPFITLLLDPSVDWTSVLWLQWFGSISKKV